MLHRLTRTINFIALCAAALLVSAAARTEARADEFTVEVTGTASVTRSTPGLNIPVTLNASLAGPGFSGAFGGGNGFYGIDGCVNFCTSGDLSTRVTGFDLFGTYTINGVEFRSRNTAALRFNSSLFTIPPELLTASGVRVTAPFTLTGNAVGGGDLVTLTGSGAAVLSLTRCDFEPRGGPCFTLTRNDRLEYIFGAQAAGVTVTGTPEPAAMILLGTGLAGAIGAARSRRKAMSGEHS